MTEANLKLDEYSDEELAAELERRRVADRVEWDDAPADVDVAVETVDEGPAHPQGGEKLSPDGNPA